MSQDQTFSSAGALRFGWATARANLAPLIVIGLVAAFLGMLQQPLSRSGWSWGLVSLAVELLQVAVTLVWVRVALRLNDGQPIDWGRAGDLLDDYLPFLVTITLYGLIVAVGLILFVVPGIIWALKFGFSPYAVIDRKLDPISALRESSRLTGGVKWHLFELALLLLGINLLGALAFGVGLLITVPTSFIAVASVYRRLQERAAHLPITRLEPFPTGA